MNTRKVIFSLVTPQDFEFDPDATEQEDRLSLEKTENRKGLFHCWQDTEEISPSSGNYIIKKVALIEETATGEIHKVSPENIKFINE